MLETLLKCFLKFRYFFITVLLVCIGGFVHFVPQLSYRVELHSLLKSDSKETLDEIKAFYKTFPPAEGDAMVTVSFDRPVTIADLRLTKSWVQDLDALPEVKRVVSSFDKLLETPYGDFTLDEWVDLAGTENEPVSLGSGQGIEVIYGNFISKDMKSLAFYVQKNGGMRSFVAALRRATENWGYKTRVLGINVMLGEGATLLREELLKLISLLLMALVLVLPLMLRSFRMAYLPLSIAVMSILIFLSLLAYVDEPITLMTTAAPLLIGVISLSNSIHLQRYFDNQRANGASVHEALKVMFKSGGTACFMTTLTTAIGFFSLLVVQHEEIRNFGFWCGVGVVLTYVSIMLFLPLLLYYFPGKSQTDRVYAIRNTEYLFRLATPMSVLLLFVAGGMVFTFFDTSIYNEVPSESQGLNDMKWFSENFKGTERIEIEVKGPLTDFEVFQSVEQLQAQLKQMEGVKGVSSYTSLLRYMSPTGVLDYEDGLGPAAKALDQLPDYPRNILNKEKNHACLVFFTSSDFGSGQFRTFKKRFQEIQSGLSNKAEYSLNGYVNMAYGSINYITDSLFYSLGISILAITVVLLLYLRSIPLSILCLVPNVLPVVVTLGVAGWFKIPVGVGFIVILIIGLGLAVDDTVHLVIKFLKLKKHEEQLCVRDCLRQAVSTTGYAIIITSIVIVVAALTFLQSSFSTLQETGLVLGVVTASAIVADLFVFPWILEKYYMFLNKLKLS